jgi:FkbM family methyltransferase
MLRWVARDGKLAIRYRMSGLSRRAFLRMAHLQSDLCVALELAVSDSYRLNQLNEPEFVVDGGGNTGLFTLAASARWPRARFVVCEPVPSNLDILKQNLALNGITAEVFPLCLGGAPGRARFYCREAMAGSFSPEIPYTSVIEVGIITLSDICRGHEGQEILIKLDIEGAEVAVMGEFLHIPRKKTTIIGELHDHDRQSAPLIHLAEKSGWRVRFLRVDTQHSNFQLFSPDLARQLSN